MKPNEAAVEARQGHACEPEDATRVLPDDHGPLASEHAPSFVVAEGARPVMGALRAEFRLDSGEILLGSVVIHGFDSSR